MNPTATSRPHGAPITVLLVDDSAVVRGLMRRWLESEGDFTIVGVGLNGRDAVEQARKLRPQVVVLDVEMPEMDGIAAIPQILTASPGTRILMASTLTERGAQATMRALAAGASDFLAKPDASHIGGAQTFRRELAERLRALAGRSASPAPAQTSPQPVAVRTPPRAGAQRLAGPAEIVVIGASTGGPQALHTLIAGIGGKLTVPILIVQHMPAMFTAILAQHLSKVSPVKVLEADDGMAVQPGGIYLARGDRHMLIRKAATGLALALDAGPPVRFCRPAVDPLFQSAAQIFHGRTLGVILTGMGMDGRDGAEAIVRAGGLVVAQDEATSTVWGMPGAVTNAGLAAAVKPLPQIAETVLQFARGHAA